MKKKVTLPNHMKPQAEHFAKIHCEIVGLGPKDKGYSEEFKKAFYNFCYEAYTHSLTPSGNLGQNPSTPKIAEKYIGSFQDLMKAIKVPEPLRTKLASQAKSIVISLTHLYLSVYQDELNVPSIKGGSNEKGKLKGYDKVQWPDGSETLVRKFQGGNINRKGSKFSSFEYTEDMKGDYTKLLQVEKNRYTRSFVATVVTIVLLKLITTPFKDSPVSTTFIPSLNPNDLENNKDAHERLYKKLVDDNTRIEMVSNVAKAMKFDLTTQKLIVVEKRKKDQTTGETTVTQESRPVSESAKTITLNDLMDLAGPDYDFERHKDSKGNYFFRLLKKGTSDKKETKKQYMERAIGIFAIKTLDPRTGEKSTIDLFGEFFNESLLYKIEKNDRGSYATDSQRTKAFRGSRINLVSYFEFNDWKRAINAMKKGEYLQFLKKLEDEKAQKPFSLSSNPKRRKKAKRKA